MAKMRNFSKTSQAENSGILKESNV